MSGLHERARQQIALLAGDDLEGEELEEAQRSVESCPDCRSHLHRLRGCLDVLEHSGKSTGAVSGPSLWPAIESRLQPIAVRRADRFNGWVPALSMAAACIALLIAGQMDAVAPYDVSAHRGDQSFQATLMPAGPRLHQPPFHINGDMNRQFISFRPLDAFLRLEPLRQKTDLQEQDALLVPVRSRYPEWYR